MTSKTSTRPLPELSYAQNAEDIVLSRVFGRVAEGFYIDVGANDPDQDSVTRFFYDRGWCGINIEPSFEYLQKLRSRRLRDTNLFCLAGENDGEATFYEISDTGLSTVRPDILQDHRERGYAAVEKRVPMKSLRSIVKEFHPGTVHFLKVDVEGYELQVLRGADWETFRPWVVLVETTVPLEGGKENPEIEEFMRQKGYQRCLFDGVSTFFVAREHAELGREISFPASSADEFQSAAYRRLQAHAEAIHAEKEAIRAEKEAIRAEKEAIRAEKNAFETSVREEWKKRDRKLADVRTSLANIEGSLSWKLTAPLRVLHGLVCHRGATLKMLKQHFRSPGGRGDASPSGSGQAPAAADTAVPRTRPEIPKILPAFSLEEVKAENASPWLELRYPLRPEPSNIRLTSGLCTKSQLASPAFRFWLDRIEVLFGMHRKLWEFAYIIQALYERGCLARGCKGLGFAVGEEPLPALFASMGCAVMATDLSPNDERAKPWAETSQLAAAKETLAKPGICPPALFDKLVSFRHVDMNHIPADLAGFDFTWSSCSFEHCGSIPLGLAFVENQMECLRPGGVAVHTTEFSLSSDDETLTEGMTVVFRKRDIDGLVHRLEKRGHHVEPISYVLGKSKEDNTVDVFPYTTDPHLKLLIAEKYVSTSIGLIIRRGD